jgi:hypothetical protein
MENNEMTAYVSSGPMSCVPKHFTADSMTLAIISVAPNGDAAQLDIAKLRLLLIAAVGCLRQRTERDTERPAIRSCAPMEIPDTLRGNSVVQRLHRELT